MLGEACKREELVWSARLPSPAKLHRANGMPVLVSMGRSLTVQVIELGSGHELAYGEVYLGRVYWMHRDADRFCDTADAMIRDDVRRVLGLFARGHVDRSWVHAGRQGELRHVA